MKLNFFLFDDHDECGLANCLLFNWTKGEGGGGGKKRGGGEGEIFFLKTHHNKTGHQKPIGKNQKGSNPLHCE